MRPFSIGRRLLESTVAVSLLVITSSGNFAYAGCSSSKDVFLNPFNKNSAHHRPVGTGAVYASSSDAATRDWLKADTFNINVGGPWGVDVASTSSSDPSVEIKARAIGADKAYGLPVTIRMPRNGLDTRVGYNTSGNTDGVAVVYDRSSGETHQLRQFNWNNGKPTAGQYRNWDIEGLGHGTKSGQRLGTSASGVAALFGILRGHEMNAAGYGIEHALQIALPRKNLSNQKCNIMLSRDIQLPATLRDGTAGQSGNNTGNIPYGALLALPANVDIGKLGLSEPGRRLAEAIRNYGIYVVDGGGCTNGGIRADQFISGGVLSQLKRDIPKIYPYIRMVLNNDVLGNAVAGGGTALAPNCAVDGKAATVSTPQSSGKSSRNTAENKDVSTPSSSSGGGAKNASSSGGKLNWNATARAKHYYLEIREANSKQKKVYGKTVKPSAAGCSSGRGTCSIATPSLRSGVDYKWKVRAVVNGKAQAYTAWAPVNGSRSSAANDDQPSSKKVAYGNDSSARSATSSSGTNSNGRELEWRATSGASHYYVEVRQATSKQPKVYGRVVKPAAGGCTSGGTCSHELPRLPAGVDYKWKVRAVVDGDPQPYTKWASLG